MRFPGLFNSYCFSIGWMFLAIVLLAAIFAFALKMLAADYPIIERTLKDFGRRILSKFVPSSLGSPESDGSKQNSSSPKGNAGMPDNPQKKKAPNA